ncbi:hypothetical protein EVAR_38169_1 [Eumeta japonica]|uniref:Uncharacterized protein n=1 Tax=Eumeta variegata TaxID=151549 RepID=A0A4C1WE49_EUMVA|nr:hypothetical protein EVAR_38169_1 [Eumeta japonica]
MPHSQGRPIFDTFSYAPSFFGSVNTTRCTPYPTLRTAQLKRYYILTECRRVLAVSAAVSFRQVSESTGGPLRLHNILPLYQLLCSYSRDRQQTGEFSGVASIHERRYPVSTQEAGNELVNSLKLRVFISDETFALHWSSVEKLKSKLSSLRYNDSDGEFHHGEVKEADKTINLVLYPDHSDSRLRSLIYSDTLKSYYIGLFL